MHPKLRTLRKYLLENVISNPKDKDSKLIIMLINCSSIVYEIIKEHPPAVLSGASSDDLLKYIRAACRKSANELESILDDYEVVRSSVKTA
jgi:hypothetical protein